MRGGAIPLLAWGTGLLVLLTINWIWTGDAIQIGTFSMATLIIYVGGGILVLLHRAALRKGPPRPRTDPQPVPQQSFAATAVGLSVGCILFGAVWANFLVFFGAGVLVLALGRLAIELRAQRATSTRLHEEERP